MRHGPGQMMWQALGTTVSGGADRVGIDGKVRVHMRPRTVTDRH
jgi:hypothetical protein